MKCNKFYVHNFYQIERNLRKVEEKMFARYSETIHRNENLHTDIKYNSHVRKLFNIFTAVRQKYRIIDGSFRRIKHNVMKKLKDNL